MKKVRNQMGLTNVKLMIPFCRTVEEGKKVIDLMQEFGLRRGEEGLEIYMMAEIPSNVILAEEFAQFLVEQGIDSISFNPDALLKGIENITKAEKLLKTKKEIKI